MAGWLSCRSTGFSAAGRAAREGAVAEAYDRFAPHFDAWQRAFGGAYDALVLPRVLAALARHQQPIRRVVDLGIGTGDLVIALARAGYEVTGVDRPQPTLDQARPTIA